MHIINVGHGFALGTVFTSFELAQKTAERLNLRNYEIVEQPDEPLTVPEVISELNAMVKSAEAAADITSLRLAAERQEYKAEPADDTKAIIERLEKRLIRERKRVDVMRFCISHIK